MCVVSSSVVRQRSASANFHRSLKTVCHRIRWG